MKALLFAIGYVLETFLKGALLLFIGLLILAMMTRAGI